MAQAIDRLASSDPAAWRLRATQAAAQVETMDSHFDRLFASYAALNRSDRDAA
jgi:hypothetical protein